MINSFKSLPLPLITALILAQSGCADKNQNTTNSAPTASNAPTALVPRTNMVLIKAGKFMRGSFPVTISRDFYLSKYEVTQGEFQSVTGRNPSSFQGDTNRPVEKVTYLEALAFCSALNKRETTAGHLPAGIIYRLPTEAEWEYAARAGTTNLYFFGDDPTLAEQYAWTLENSEGTSHPVGQKTPSPWGLYDIHGNVWEGCLDWFEPYPAKPLVDPAGPHASKFKVFRGGGWNNAVEFAAFKSRFVMSPSNGINFVGFRLALGPVIPLPRTSD